MSAPPPASPPAAPLRRVAAQSLFEARVLLSRSEQVLLALVLPGLALVVLSTTDAVDLGLAAERPVDVVAPGVIALAVLATAFTAQAITTAFDRRAGVLRFLATTPLGPGGLLGGSVGGVLVVQAVQAVVLGGLALWLGWRPAGVGVAAAVLAIVLATAAFTALALLLAGTLRAEAVLGLTNLLFVLLAAGGAVLVPAEQLPGPLAVLATLLPSGALGEALRTSLGTGALPWTELVVLTAWAVAAGLAARRWFRWF